MALGDALRRGRAKYPDRPALVVDEQTWSYAQFDAITDRIGSALQRFLIERIAEYKIP